MSKNNNWSIIGDPDKHTLRSGATRDSQNPNKQPKQKPTKIPETQAKQNQKKTRK